jgi:hypothetical protein
VSLAFALSAVGLLVAGVASARTAAVPQNTSAATVSGNTREGETLTAANGTWNNSPAKFTYQWQRCSSTGTGCADITGAQDRTYTLGAADADHTLRVVVTASNADGQSSSTSKTTDLVSSKNGPVNTVKPSISGTAQVGEELTVDPGTWTGGVRSFAYQWQRCSAAGSSCSDVSGASGKTYGVRTADVGKVLQVIVTATNASGSNTAPSSASAAVRAATGSTPVATPQPRRNHAPTISFLSLKRIGLGVYARFRVCDDSLKRVTVVQRDAKAGKLAYTRKFAVTPVKCQTASRHWVPAARFRTPGRLVVTLRAIDKSGATSPTVRRALSF